MAGWGVMMAIGAALFVVGVTFSKGSDAAGDNLAGLGFVVVVVGGLWGLGIWLNQ